MPTTRFATLDLRIEYYAQVRQHGENVLRGLLCSQNDLGEPFLIDLYQATQIRDYREASDTYDELISSGTLNLGFKDRHL